MYYPMFSNYVLYLCYYLSAMFLSLYYYLYYYLYLLLVYISISDGDTDTPFLIPNREHKLSIWF